jgi:hypothetical protein
MYEVIFYKDKFGREPIKEFIYELKKNSVKNKNDRIHFEKIMTYIGALQKYGTRIGAPIVKHICYRSPCLTSICPVKVSPDCPTCCHLNRKSKADKAA